MNITKHRLGAVVLAVTVSLGAASAASAAADDPITTPDRESLIAAICEDPDAAIGKISDRLAKVSERIATLTERRTVADDAGRTKLVARIDNRIASLEKALQRLNTRLDKAPDWIAEHCS